MDEARELQILSKASQMLAEASTIDEIRNIMNLAEAARAYAKKAKLGLEVSNSASEIRLRAERKAGQVLAQVQREQGKRTDLTSTNGGGSSEYSRVLDDTGTKQQDASRWQKVASLPSTTFEDHIAEAKAKGKELTTSGVVRLSKFEKAQQNKTQPPNLEGKYRVIYADPPWKYHDRLAEDYGVAEFHYPTMTIEELCELPIKELAEENSVLFLWVTAPMLAECWTIIKAWGFEYKTHFVWDKIKHNWGHYNSVRHELLFICTRGSCLPDCPELFDSVQSIERKGEHSEKPEEFRHIIDVLYTHGDRIELFARKKVDGWEYYSNECDRK